MDGRPPIRQRDFHVQYSRKPLRCQRMRVIRFEDLQRLQATWPQAVESDPEQPLAPVKPESFMRRLVYHGKLLTKRQDFELQEGAASE